MSKLDPDEVDWKGLRALRAGFLDGSTHGRDYWASSLLLESYDRTLGERIGWKWDFVLDELELRGWRPPPGPVLDWGCGTGVAGRRFMRRFSGVGPLVCSDRSAAAQDFARAAAERAGFDVAGGAEPATVVVSHVASELDRQGLDQLLATLEQAVAVVWVEPGDRANGRVLSELRDRLLGTFSTVAPCTHQQPCPLLDPRLERHWCHHFASPPNDAFTDPGWGRFSAEMGIDLRSLPVAFIVLDRRAVAAWSTGAVHTIGRPRVSKAEVRVFGCDATGVRDVRITKRRLPDTYRSAKKGRLSRLATWQVADDEVVAWNGW